MKKLLFFGGVFLVSGVLFAGCQQTDWLKEKALNKLQNKVQEREVQTFMVEEFPLGDETLIKEVESEIEKPADVEKVLNEVDNILKQLDESSLDID